jgi:hypothetical protein
MPSLIIYFLELVQLTEYLVVENHLLLFLKVRILTLLAKNISVFKCLH